ncbi:hypothetical protein ABNF97_19295 [Plantactinospora sp. B6F1]
MSEGHERNGQLTADVAGRRERNGQAGAGVPGAGAERHGVPA